MSALPAAARPKSLNRTPIDMDLRPRDPRALLDGSLATAVPGRVSGGIRTIGDASDEAWLGQAISQLEINTDVSRRPVDGRGYYAAPGAQEETE